MWYPRSRHTQTRKSTSRIRAPASLIEALVARGFGHGLPFPLVLAVLVLLAGPVSVRGQVVVGTVVSANTLQPLVGAEVVVEGTRNGTLTDGGGRFRLEGLQSTQVTLRVEMLGFRTLTQAVQVGDSGIRLELSPQAISLDEIVVTGQAREIEKRAIGTVVASLSVPEQLNRQAPVNINHSWLTPFPVYRSGIGGEMGRVRDLKTGVPAAFRWGSVADSLVDGRSD